jgi:hypothetical protein
LTCAEQTRCRENLHKIAVASFFDRMVAQFVALNMLKRMGFPLMSNRKAQQLRHS